MSQQVNQLKYTYCDAYNKIKNKIQGLLPISRERITSQNYVYAFKNYHL